MLASRSADQSSPAQSTVGQRDPPAAVPIEQLTSILGDVLCETLERRRDEADAMIQQGQALVRSLALKAHRGLPVRVDLDDLIAYGQLGLAEASAAYDPDCGVKFTTFAFHRIRGAIYDGVSKMTWTSRGRLRRRAQAGENSTTHFAVIQLAGGEDDAIDSAIARDESPLGRAVNGELKTVLRRLVNQLPRDAQRLIQGIYFDGFTLTEAADRMGMSKSWASRLHAKTLGELGRLLKEMDSQ